jgi:hypothetical protein
LLIEVVGTFEGFGTGIAEKGNVGLIVMTAGEAIGVFKLGTQDGCDIVAFRGFDVVVEVGTG